MTAPDQDRGQREGASGKAMQAPSPQRNTRFFRADLAVARPPSGGRGGLCQPAGRTVPLLGVWRVNQQRCFQEACLAGYLPGAGSSNMCCLCVFFREWGHTTGLSHSGS